MSASSRKDGSRVRRESRRLEVRDRRGCSTEPAVKYEEPIARREGPDLDSMPGGLTRGSRELIHRPAGEQTRGRKADTATREEKQEARSGKRGARQDHNKKAGRHVAEITLKLLFRFEAG